MDGKLVRDHIPEIIRENGERAEYHTLDDMQYRQALLEKLCEEAAELRDNPSLEERADIAEVLRAIDELLAFTPDDVEAARREKREARGGFDKRIYLDRIKRG